MTKNSELKKVHRLNIVVTLLLWIIAYPVGLQIISSIKSLHSKAISIEAAEKVRNSTETALNKLDIKRVIWNSEIGYFELSIDGHRRYLIRSEDAVNLTIDCNVSVLAPTDTLGWAKLTLDHARNFLPGNVVMQYDSTIKNKNYIFGYELVTSKVTVFIPPTDSAVTRKAIIGVYYHQPYGNFRLSVPVLTN